MRNKYKTAITITILLVILSITISLTNYTVALNSTQEQLKTQALPLSLDNIYSEIQKHIVEPHLVSSMMAHDTFVKEWITTGEKSSEQIEKYLGSIKNKYGMFTTFLVSNDTKNYYTYKGKIKNISKKTAENLWYYDFEKNGNSHEINLDFNKDVSNDMIMFINVKIFDNNYTLLGITGIGIKISHISEMLKKFHQQYNFKVYFLNKNGEIILSEDKEIKHLNEIKELAIHKTTIISNSTNILEYSKNNQDYIVNTKFIPELGLYLLVEANVDSFTKNVKRVFYFDLIISLFITFIVALIIINVVRKNQKKLEHLADTDPLTELKNRRVFSNSFNYFFQLFKRDQNPLCLLFIDIDDFKSINDNYGHNIGDKVLTQISKTLSHNIRSTDLIARWGGEEFVILFINTSIEEAKEISSKLLKSIEDDLYLKELVRTGVTASLGLTNCTNDDSTETIINRADKAMYAAKENGKNQIVVK